MKVTVNTHRFDPYRNFKFRVKWDGKYVAGISKVGALKRSIELVEHREGGDPSSSRKSPGSLAYPGTKAEEIAALSIGERDARLLLLREWMFGRHMQNMAICPACSEKNEW